MRRALITFLITFLFIPFLSFAESEEIIRNFHSDITIHSDATFQVDEKIRYDFGSNQKHGIFRYIPFRYKTKEGKTRLTPITNISVQDERGSSYKFVKSVNNDFLELKIGDADKYVTGQKTYIISYKVEGAINHLDTHDELYWNVTGSDWPVMIEKASATVTLPDAVKREDFSISCYVGFLGSNEECESGYPALLREESANENSAVPELKTSADFKSKRPLSIGEGITIAAGFPKGIVVQKDYIYEVPFLSTLLGKVWLAGNILVPLIFLIGIVIWWMKKGRDPRGRGTIIVQYDAPDGVDPIAVGTLMDQKVDKKDISAGIIDLAVKGYLKIKRLDGKGIFKTKDYELTKIKGTGGLSDYETKIMDALFKDDEVVKLKDLSTSFAQDIKEAQKMVYKALVDKGYFSKNPQTIRTIYLVVGFLLLVGGIAGVMFVPGVIAIGAIIIFFSFFMPARTLKGVYAREHILGLKEYLSIAEKDRIKFHNAPEKNPETFEKFLPYAMALGVEKEWAKQFEGIFRENPTWYSDPSMRTFSAIAFTDSIGSFSSAAGAVSVPASSGGSGVGGGGFSGGGMGGGGGGSW
ncbi:DUF2207 domain-containing protein [candidate division WS5 bacterium]|uniref:DUF2207 domain-containing protein n=1 Tax=candidate division WS5 bacterium TaxID=2093353 RepID=A0A419DAD5_9BACT|nr:MAG: DUF2207 domain-containing protein [candidate division WS5 bacterium]